MSVGAAFDFHAGTVKRAPRWNHHSDSSGRTVFFKSLDVFGVAIWSWPRSLSCTLPQKSRA